MKRLLFFIFGLLLFTCAACAGTPEQATVAAQTETADQSELKSWALELAMSFFEDIASREFHVSYPTVINDTPCCMVEISGVLAGGESYPIGTLAFSDDTGARYIYDEQKSEYVQIATDPRFACADSPDGKWRAESLGAGMDGPSGMYSLREMRIISLSDGAAQWSGESYLGNSFCWSDDSRFVAAEHSGRQWSQVIIIDTVDFSTVTLPGVSEILTLSPDTPPVDPGGWSALHFSSWSGAAVTISFEWYALGDLYVEGEYEYDLIHKTLNIMQIGAAQRG